MATLNMVEVYGGSGLPISRQTAIFKDLPLMIAINWGAWAPLGYAPYLLKLMKSKTVKIKASHGQNMFQNQ